MAFSSFDILLPRWGTLTEDLLNDVASPPFLWPVTVITRISIMVIISLRWSLTTNCAVRAQSCHTVCVTCPYCCRCSCRSSPTVTQMAVASKSLFRVTFLLPRFFCTPFRRVFPKHLGNSDFQGLCDISRIKFKLLSFTVTFLPP